MSHPALEALKESPQLGPNTDKAKQFAEAVAHPSNKLLDVDEKGATLTFPSGTVITMPHDYMIKLMKRPASANAMMSLMKGQGGPSDVNKLLMELQRVEMAGAKYVAGPNVTFDPKKQPVDEQQASSASEEGQAAVGS